MLYLVFTRYRVRCVLYGTPYANIVILKEQLQKTFLLKKNGGPEINFFREEFLQGTSVPFEKFRLIIWR